MSEAELMVEMAQAVNGNGLPLDVGQTLPLEIEAMIGCLEQPTLRRMKAQMELLAIGRALSLTRWNRKQAAKLLKISYRSLLYKIRQHDIKKSA
jgi:transcriptional regulator with PAS, ATPase and Fis domain